ncbi:cytochrome c oxidase subunit III (mitochondrion) [Theileria orientalis]|uniref:Cytochrome c oxidase subunit 3 n=1 Tax=Theileria orientalis TaxID=68886 RepID=A0A976SI58_THEOR|nr:cytochrome c oxidase subunit III [Theileria orientalis]
MTSSTAILYAIIGMFIFSEIMVFSTFIWGFFHNRLSNSSLINEINMEAYLQISDVLNIGSILVSLISHKIQENSLYEVDLMTEELILVSLIFLSLQNDEYSLLSCHLNDYWITLYFFILTGLHSLHVCVGCIFSLIQSFLYECDGSIRDDDCNSGVYWHFVEMIWIALTMLLFSL